MKDIIYVRFDGSGVRGFSKNPPQLMAGQFAVRIDILVDDKYFKRIIPIAKMELDSKFIIEPKIELEPQEVFEDVNTGEVLS